MYIYIHHNLLEHDPVNRTSHLGGDPFFTSKAMPCALAFSASTWTQGFPINVRSFNGSEMTCFMRMVFVELGSSIFSLYTQDTMAIWVVFFIFENHEYKSTALCLPKQKSKYPDPCKYVRARSQSINANCFSLSVTFCTSVCPDESER